MFFIFIRFSDDLERSTYDESARLSLDTPLSRVAKQIKLLVYLKDIGALNPMINLPSRFKNFIFKNSEVSSASLSEDLNKETIALDKLRLENFKKLINTYPIDKDKFTFLLDKSLCSHAFIHYLEVNEYKILDLNEAFGPSKEPTTLIYDQHWSKHGRSLVAAMIINYLNNNNN